MFTATARPARRHHSVCNTRDGDRSITAGRRCTSYGLACCMKRDTHAQLPPQCQQQQQHDKALLTHHAASVMSDLHFSYNDKLSSTLISRSTYLASGGTQRSCTTSACPPPPRRSAACHTENRAQGTPKQMSCSHFYSQFIQADAIV